MTTLLVSKKSKSKLPYRTNKKIRDPNNAIISSDKEFLQQIYSFSNLTLKLIFGIVILICFMNRGYSQGFSWELDSRMPYKIPESFVGFNIGYSSVNHLADFNLREDLIECCNFGDASGKAYFAGITAEYWYSGYIALNASLNFVNVDGNFAIEDAVPTRTGEFRTKYEMKSSNKYISFEISAKHRIKDLHLGIGGGLSSLFLLSGTAEYTEQAISDNVPFEKRVLSRGNVNELKNVLILPFVQVNYDADLGIGYYATPYMNLSYSLNSVLSDDNWRMLSINIGIKLFRSL